MRGYLPLVLVLLLVPASGCLSLEPAHVPATYLDEGVSNHWRANATLTTEVGGGFLSKHAARGYDDPGTGPGYPGVLVVQSFRGLLSPDRETLRDELAQRLRDEAASQGLEVQRETDTGMRTLANGAVSFYTVINATGTRQSLAFNDEATVKGIGEVVRCTGGPTVIIKGFAQVDSARSLGGIQTSREYEPRTWKEMVQDPQGTIEGFRGSLGLIYNLACG